MMYYRLQVASLLLVFSMAPAVASAQTPAVPAPSMVDRDPRGALHLASAAIDEGARELLTQQRPAPPPPPPPERGRRRPSMVGYIEDPTVATRVRFRFDTATGNDVPDRAEFFYAKCGCYQLDPPPFFDPDAPGPGPGVPTALNFQQFYILGEMAVQDRFSIFAELPIRAIQPQGFLDFGPEYAPFPDTSGLADVRFGVKAALVADDMNDLTVQVRASAPTGDARKGLGTNNASIEPALLYQGRMSDRVRLEAQVGTWLPLGGSAGPDSPDNFSGTVFFYGVGPSFDVVATDQIRFAPVIELVGWRVLNGFGTQCTLDGCEFDASGTNIVNLKIGARAAMISGHSIYAGYGWGLTDEQWYDKIFRVEYRFGF